MFEWYAERISRCGSLCRSEPNCTLLDISVHRYHHDQQWASLFPNTCGRSKRLRSATKGNASADRCCNRFRCIRRVNCDIAWEKPVRGERVDAGNKHTSDKRREQKRSPAVTKREVHRVSNEIISCSEWSPVGRCRRSVQSCRPCDEEWLSSVVFVMNERRTSADEH